MKRKSWLLWGLVLVAVVFFLGATAGLAYLMLGKTTPSVGRGTVVEVSISGEYRDAPPPPSFSIPGFGFGGSSPSVMQLRENFETLRRDTRVPSVLLRIGAFSSSWGLIEEMREAILGLRKSGKKVVAFVEADFVDERTLYLACACDRIATSPEAAVMMDGLVSDQLFFRKALDKLKIEPYMVQYKEYKGAFESMVNDKMSGPLREELESVVGEIWDRFLATVAADRKVRLEDLAVVVEKGWMTADDAVTAKLIDRTGFLDEIRDELKPKDGEYKGVKLAKFLRSARKGGFTSRPKIAVVYAEGGIFSAEADAMSDDISGPRLAQILRDAEKDDDIKAIILRVNSPGGSAVGSDFVWRQVMASKKKKPIVVSMGGVAASGGYWISMAADAIVAEPSCITGSIGVIFGKLNLKPFLEQYGITTDRIQRGKMPDSFSMFSPLTPEHEAQVKIWMGRVYDDFVAKASAGRKMTPDKLEPLAHGRIWTGAQAKERGLIDDVGGLDRAVAIAREKAKIASKDEVDLVAYPKRKKLLDLLFEDELFPFTETSIASRLPFPEPHRTEIAQLLALSRPQVWALSPAWPAAWAQ